MPVYPVLEPLKHDGQAYAHGDTVEMEAKAAKDLLLLGVLAPAVKAVSKTTTGAATGAATKATQETETAAADLAKSAATGGDEAISGTKEEGK